MFEPVAFLLGCDMAAIPLELLLKPPGNRRVRDDGTFIRTQNTVVEALRVGDHLRRAGDIGRLIDIGRHIAGTDPERRIAG